MPMAIRKFEEPTVGAQLSEIPKLWTPNGSYPHTPVRVILHTSWTSLTLTTWS